MKLTNVSNYGVALWFCTPLVVNVESLAPTESNYVSSTQREESSSTEDLNLQQWSSLESSVDDSRFSGEMYDVISIEQQRKEELAAMAPPSESSIVSEGSRRTEQWVDDARRRSEDERWPNSNAMEAATEEGCSRPRVLEPQAPAVEAREVCCKTSPLQDE